MSLTDVHASYYAHELTERCASDSVEKLASVLADAEVDLNPHQVEAALFAFRSPFSKGALGAVPAPSGKNGKPALRARINGFNNAARHAPWMVLVDLDGDEDCAPPLRHRWLPAAAPLLCFRIAVRQVEAWLLPDAEALANYLSISRTRASSDLESYASAMIPKDCKRLAALVDVIGRRLDHHETHSTLRWVLA